MSRKKTKHQIKSPRKPGQSHSATPLPFTPLTEALGMMQAGELDHAMELVDAHLKVNRNDALAHQLKGLVLHRLKRYDEAAQSLRASLHHGQPQASWYLNLGVSLRAARHLDEAIHTFEQAHTMDPGYAPARYQLAMTLLDKAAQCREQGDHEQAVVLLNQAIHHDASCHEAQYLLAVIHDETGQRTRAITMLKQVLSEVPDHHQSRLHLVTMLSQAGELKQAQEHLAQLPDTAATRIAKAQLQHLSGQSHEAWSELQIIQEAEYQDINYLTLLAQLAPKFQQTQQAIDSLEASLSDTRPVGQQVLLHFALHQLYDRLGDFDRAFDHASQANTLKKGLFFPEKQAFFVNSMMHATGTPASGCTDDRPLFIVGMPRSGTSLIEQILGRHPDVYPAGELNHINNLADQLTRQAGYPGDVDPGTALQLAHVYQKAMNQCAPAARRFTDKMPTNFLHLGLIAQMFPDARVIHCTRHPLDTCLSCYFQNFGNYHAYTQRLDWLCSYYQQYQRLMAHWKQVLPIALLDVAYESLVQSPEAQIKRLVDFAGLSWDQRCLSPHESDRTVVTASNQQVREPIYQRSVSRWKSYEKHLVALVALLGD